MAEPYPMQYVAPTDGETPELEPKPVTIYGLPAVPSTAQVRTAVSTKPQIVALAAVSTANATDLPTAQALANANKVAINAIIAALKA